MQPTELSCFKAYDVRGRLGPELNEDIAYRIARAFAQTLEAKRVVLGRDIRPTSTDLSASVARGLQDAGCEVLDLGLSGTEEMYFATTHLEACGGICVTASHNPMDYNGMKMVRAGSAPIGQKTGLSDIKSLAEAGVFLDAKRTGSVTDASSARQAYVERVVGFASIETLKPLTILVNAGHGTAGPTFDAIAERLQSLGAPLTFKRLFHAPDGSFPQGIPNPLLPENRPATAKAVVEAGADFGVAWDGDFDRCFFFDHRGEFIDGEYVVGLLAQAFLTKDPEATVLYDPRVIWNTLDVVQTAGGTAVASPTGHAFFKQIMRDKGAVYGGEMSAHHYFRDFVCCDSGMIPWLLVAELVSRHGPLADLIADRKAAFPSSGEINFTLTDPDTSIAHVRAAFEPEARSIDEIDGLSFDMGDWRFNLRRSNTEPVVRLNVEAKGHRDLVAKGVERVKACLFE